MTTECGGCLPGLIEGWGCSVNPNNSRFRPERLCTMRTHSDEREVCMAIRKIMNKTLIAAGIMLFAMMGTAGAGSLTVIKEAPGDELSLLGEGGVLNQLYFQNWETDLQRVSDDFDQIWRSLNGEAQALARFAANSQNFGYIDSTGFNSLIVVDEGTFLFGDAFSAKLPSLSKFEFALNSPSNSDFIWSSDPFRNDGNDHMVTFKVIGGDFFDPDTVTYVIAWEDWPGLGDQDYNDLVVEVRGVKPIGVKPIPEPHTLLLLGLGLMVLAMAKRTKRGCL